jgi:hypothetical protein
VHRAGIEDASIVAGQTPLDLKAVLQEQIHGGQVRLGGMDAEATATLDCQAMFDLGQELGRHAKASLLDGHGNRAQLDRSASGRANHGEANRLNTSTRQPGRARTRHA